METWLIVDDGQDLPSKIHAELSSLGAEIELLTATDADQAVGCLATTQAKRLVIRAACRSVDSLGLICAALQLKPELEVVLCSDPGLPLTGPTSLATGVCFVAGPAEAAQLASPAQGPALDSRERPRRRPDIVDTVRIVQQSGLSRAVRVASAEGRGRLGFVAGSLAYAVAGSLTGNDAFLQMTLWEESSFEGIGTCDVVADDAAVTAPTAELLQQAVSLRRAIEGDVPELSVDELSGALKGGCREIVDWWARAASGTQAIIRILVAYSPSSHCSCVNEFTDQLADLLVPVRQWKSEPEHGPAFIRLHAADNKVLALTFISMTTRNRFFFETFSKASECVVICRPGDNGDLEGWASWVPEGVRRVISRQPQTDVDRLCPVLQGLWRDQP